MLYALADWPQCRARVYPEPKARELVPKARELVPKARELVPKARELVPNEVRNFMTVL
jgi:hypothetical protein